MENNFKKEIKMKSNIKKRVTLSGKGPIGSGDLNKVVGELTVAYDAMQTTWMGGNADIGMRQTIHALGLKVRALNDLHGTLRGKG